MTRLFSIILLGFLSSPLLCYTLPLTLTNEFTRYKQQQVKNSEMSQIVLEHLKSNPQETQYVIDYCIDNDIDLQVIAIILCKISAKNDITPLIHKIIDKSAHNLLILVLQINAVGIYSAIHLKPFYAYAKKIQSLGALELIKLFLTDEAKL